MGHFRPPTYTTPDYDATQLVSVRVEMRQLWAFIVASSQLVLKSGVDWSNHRRVRDTIAGDPRRYTSYAKHYGWVSTERWCIAFSVAARRSESH